MSGQRSPWPQSVPGWQPSRERLPPASWAVLGLGGRMMALYCAVVSIVEYSCRGSSIHSAAAFASRKKYDNNVSATNTTLSMLSILGVSIICVKRFQRRYGDSMYYCCCIPEIHAFVPNLCRLIAYQGKHDRLSKTPTLHSSRTTRKHLRLLQSLKSWSSASCDQLCCTSIGIFV